MDKNRATIIVETDVADDVITRNFLQFLETIENDNRFDVSKPVLTLSKDYGVTSIPMSRQQTMDDVLSAISKNVNVNILYQYRDNGGRDRKTIAYSMPYEDEMFIISIESYQYGIVEEIDMTFCCSLDKMLHQLQKCRDFIHCKKVEAIEEQPLAEMYKIFV